ncbi:MAG: hypothetical protein EOP59_05715 [Sphingomonadales bacterium]|nr:MAG: hypothetical protein EOP59_05715 [Sphingomonadales bacterium]
MASAMSRRPIPAKPPRAGPLRTLGKLAFGVVVFAAILVGWSYFRPKVINRLQLPDSVAAGDATGCALWFVGSSSIAKWETLERDFPGWQTHRRGIDGARIDDIEARILVTDSTVKPAGLVFYAGENDIANGASGAEAAAAMLGMIDKVRTRLPTVPVFVIGIKPSPERWPQRNEQLRYNTIVSRSAQRLANVTLVPTGATLMREGVPIPALYTDGVHLSAEGYSLWAQDIQRELERAMPRDRIAACSPTPPRTPSPA